MKTYDVCVVALGKIGLPLAVQIASMGHNVIGADVNAHTVDLVNSATPPFFEPGLNEGLQAGVQSGRLSATTDTTDAVSRSNVVIIVVPLLVDSNDDPDFTYMDAATHAVASGLKPGTLVSYETTLPINSATDRFVPMLEERTSLKSGVDFFVCHSPERVSSGTVFRDLRKYPKLVGGVDTASSAVAVEFYESILEFDERDDLPKPNGVWDLGSSVAAEFAKLAETTYRDVNIALANEFARHADELGININDVIDASNSQPFSHIHRPGIAVGGHCIPVYPRLYMSTDTSCEVPKTSRESNNAMPTYAVDRLERRIVDFAGYDGTTVGIWGVAYRGDVKEDAVSGAYPLQAELQRRGANVVVHDPLYSNDELAHMGFDPWDGTSDVSYVFIQANHAEYNDLDATSIPGLRGILDGRNILDPNTFESAGICVFGIGDGR